MILVLADLVATVKAALSDSGLPAQRLELEITESVLLQNSDTTRAMLHQIRELGIKIRSTISATAIRR